MIQYAIRLGNGKYHMEGTGVKLYGKKSYAQNAIGQRHYAKEYNLKYMKRLRIEYNESYFNNYWWKWDVAQVVPVIINEAIETDKGLFPKAFVV